MQNREREWPVLLPVNCNGTLANIAEKGSKILDESDWKMSFEEIPDHMEYMVPKIKHNAHADYRYERT